MAHLFVIAGHGAGDSGAVGYGYTEAERVRALAGRLAALGGNNVTVGDTKRNWYADKGISSLSIPKNWQIIELHMDGASPSARGGHVIIKSGYNPDSYDTALAQFIGGFTPGRANTIVGRSNLANVNRAAAKGYSYRLLECGFITNQTDLNKFNSNLDDLARGILSAFGIGAVAKAGWIFDKIGWWYRSSDGSYPKNQWCQIGGDWYWFDNRGYAVHDTWKEINGLWYYFKSDCRMVKGWRKVDGKWYYLNPQAYTNHPEGAMEDGWVLDGQFWYYLNPTSGGPRGSMSTGLITSGDFSYYCRPTAENGYPEGSMITGWKFLNNDWYYFNVSNAGSPYGAMLKNTWVEDNGKKYFMKEDGKMAKSESVCIGRFEYTFSKSGTLENTLEKGE